jgi:plasmid stabilization system protein ParE
MDFNVLIADSAIADLKEIVEFVAQDDAEARVASVINWSIRRSHCERFRRGFHFMMRRGIRKMPLPPFLVFYTCDEVRHVVNVLHFWHGARQPPHFRRSSN